MGLMNLGPTELIIILAIVLLVFGSTKLPKLARSMGQAQKEFKKGVNEGAKDTEDPDAGSSGEASKT
jgi:sec-independent protein translocase protein TatA